MLESYIIGLEAHKCYAQQHGSNMRDSSFGSWYLSPGATETFWDTSLEQAKAAQQQLRQAHHLRVVSTEEAEELARIGIKSLHQRLSYLNSTDECSTETIPLENAGWSLTDNWEERALAILSA
jgi:hypothetical protein